ncbi:hypothetical protein JW835_16615 [bacterium]|nr:hypothetical protein [bacterium]
MAKRRRTSSGGSGILTFYFMLFLISLALFLWGRVHIDFVIQELEIQKIEKQSLLREIDDLRVQINDLQKYRRIVNLAKAQGLVIADRSNSESLMVDFSGLDGIQKYKRSGLQVAGFSPPLRMNNKNSISPFQDTEDAK